MMRRTLGALSLLLAFGACGAAELDDVRARVEAVNRDWVKAIAAGDFHRSVDGQWRVIRNLTL